jgi:hypothetical protein
MHSSERAADLVNTKFHLLYMYFETKFWAKFSFTTMKTLFGSKWQSQGNSATFISSKKHFFAKVHTSRKVIKKF